MSLTKLQNLVLTSGVDGDESMAPITVKELRALVMSASMLQVAASDLELLKWNLDKERGPNLRRTSDVRTLEEINAIISESMMTLPLLDAGDLSDETIGDFVFSQIHVHSKEIARLRRQLVISYFLKSTFTLKK